jgi:hypothetical protein
MSGLGRLIPSPRTLLIFEFSDYAVVLQAARGHRAGLGDRSITRAARGQVGGCVGAQHPDRAKLPSVCAAHEAAAGCGASDPRLADRADADGSGEAGWVGGLRPEFAMAALVPAGGLSARLHFAATQVHWRFFENQPSDRRMAPIRFGKLYSARPVVMDRASHWGVRIEMRQPLDTIASDHRRRFTR